MAIPLKTRAALAADPFMRRCIYRALMVAPTPCSGRVEWEHAMAKMGWNCQEPFALVPVCTEHHRGKGLIKQFNVLVALNRATDAQLRAASRAEDLVQRRKHLREHFRLDLKSPFTIPLAPTV